MSAQIWNRHRQDDVYRVCRACLLGCCNGARPPLTPRRMRLIESYLKANGLGIVNPFEVRDYVFPRETDDGYCVFFKKSASKCTIHKVKPETCVAGPITFDINQKTGRIEWFLKNDRICPLAGSLYRDKEAFNNHLKSAKREIRRLTRDMDNRALRAILTIEEPDTFKVDEDVLDSKVMAKLKL